MILFVLLSVNRYSVIPCTWQLRGEETSNEGQTEGKDIIGLAGCAPTFGLSEALPVLQGSSASTKYTVRGLQVQGLYSSFLKSNTHLFSSVWHYKC